MIEKQFKIAVLICLILTLTFGLVVDLDGVEEQSLNGDVEHNSISTGSMPADTIEERAEMRKMTAMVDYKSEDLDT